MSELIWETKIEENYTCKVNRVDDNTGLLQIVNDTTGVVVYEQEIAFTHGPAGVSTVDISEWYKICVDTIAAQ